MGYRSIDYFDLKNKSQVIRLILLIFLLIIPVRSDAEIKPIDNPYRLQDIVSVFNIFFSPKLLLIIVVLSCSTGSVDSKKIQIRTIEELQKIGTDPNYPLNGKYELVNDIDASETRFWNGEFGFNPIGNETAPFTGEFDGNGFKITELYINRNNTNNVGLFSCVGPNGEVKNLGLEKVYVCGNFYVGGIAGENKGTVKQCYTTGTVNGKSFIGAVTGINKGGLNQCYSIAEVDGGWNVGGLTGGNVGTILQCHSSSSVKGSEDGIGGLVGGNTEGSVLRSYSNGYVEGRNITGGLVGINKGIVSQSYTTAKVTAMEEVGGLVGSNQGEVSQCYSAGKVEGTDFVGGLIGWDSGGTVYQSYWDMDASGLSSSSGGSGKTSEEMKQKDTYIDWDFENVWKIIENETYPYLIWEEAPHTKSVAEKVIQIKSIEELQKIGRDPDYPLYGKYELIQDIDATKTRGWNEGQGFEPIGDASNPFLGEFDGKGHKIIGLFINRPESDYVGLFGCIGPHAEAKNLKLQNSYIAGNRYVGGLAGKNEGKIVQCYNGGGIEGKEWVGCLIGDNRGQIEMCSTRGKATGIRFVGGLIGRNFRGTIYQCGNEADAEGSWAGGLVGANYQGTITKSYNKGWISGEIFIGGLAGINYEGTISQCYSEGRATGKFAIGDLVGENKGVIEDSHLYKDRSEQNTSMEGIDKSTNVI